MATHRLKTHTLLARLQLTVDTADQKSKGQCLREAETKEGDVKPKEDVQNADTQPSSLPRLTRPWEFQNPSQTSPPPMSLLVWYSKHLSRAALKAETCCSIYGR